MKKKLKQKTKEKNYFREIRTKKVRSKWTSNKMGNAKKGPQQNGPRQKDVLRGYLRLRQALRLLFVSRDSLLLLYVKHVT